MASIKGLSIKNLKSFIGYEGEIYQGNLYYKNKKIGFWSQDANGGITDDFVLDEGYEALLEQTAKEYCTEYKTLLKECFMDKLLELTLDHKEFKKFKKKYNPPYVGFVTSESMLPTLTISCKSNDKDAVTYCKYLYVKNVMPNVLEEIKKTNNRKKLLDIFDSIHCRIYGEEKDFVV